MKRFDLANEVAKQLITIASAIITVLVAFYEKFFSHEDWIFILVFVVLLIFILSILIGVLSIGGLTTLVESQEHNEWLRTNPPPTGTRLTRSFHNLTGQALSASRDGNRFCSPRACFFLSSFRLQTAISLALTKRHAECYWPETMGIVPDVGVSFATGVVLSLAGGGVGCGVETITVRVAEPVRPLGSVTV